MTEGIGCGLANLQSVVRVYDLNAMALKVGVICRHRPMPEQLACTANFTLLSFRGQQNNAILQVKVSVNVGMAMLVNLGAGMELERGQRCECVKKEGCTKKQNTHLNFYVTNLIIGEGFEFAASNDNM